MLTLMTGMRERQDDEGSGLSALMVTLTNSQRTQFHLLLQNWLSTDDNGYILLPNDFCQELGSAATFYGKVLISAYLQFGFQLKLVHQANAIM